MNFIFIKLLRGVPMQENLYNRMMTFNVIVFVFLVYYTEYLNLVNCQNENDYQYSTHESDVDYFLYTRNNPVDPINLRETLTNFNPKLPTKMIIHGWIENSFRDWCKKMINAYLKKGNYNVISVDWSKKSRTLYTFAVYNARSTGTVIADFLLKLKIHNTTHIISHSLGSHIAGFVGKHIYGSVGNKIPRLTALDPSGPLYEFPIVHHDFRLDKSDALFVDVIHTNGFVLGLAASIGTADFFPNSGLFIQPGCLKVPQVFTDFYCSHQRSHEYFTESINSEGFRAKSCSSWNDYQAGKCDRNEDVPFGEGTWSNLTGSFYLRTNSKAPYAVL